MDGPRLDVVRYKNAAYDALCNARRLCDRRRHTTGTLPAAWLAKLGELEEEYTRAVMTAKTLGGVM